MNIQILKEAMNILNERSRSPEGWGPQQFWNVKIYGDYQQLCFMDCCCFDDDVDKAARACPATATAIADFAEKRALEYHINLVYMLEAYRDE
jgi:hypothetical protein